MQGEIIVQICSRCKTSNTDTATHCQNCQADLSEWSQLAVARKELQENPRISHIRISVTNDCCPACAQFAGVYPKDTVPQLPVEGCSHDLGCRCFYLPVLTEIYP